VCLLILTRYNYNYSHSDIKIIKILETKQTWKKPNKNLLSYRQHRRRSSRKRRRKRRKLKKPPRELLLEKQSPSRKLPKLQQKVRKESL